MSRSTPVKAIATALLASATALPSAAEVWHAVEALVRESGLEPELIDRDASALVTKARKFGRSDDLPPRPPEPDDFQAYSFQLHIFVPRSATPGRIYVGSIVRARSGARHAHFYNGRSLELWLLDRVGRALGESGEWIPDNEKVRYAMARRLRPEIAEDRRQACASAERPSRSYSSSISDSASSSRSRCTNRFAAPSPVPHRGFAAPLGRTTAAP